MDGPIRRREFLCAAGVANAVALAGCTGFLESDDGVRDSDDDGVVDSADYAPRDPAVQEKADVQGEDCTCPETETEPETTQTPTATATPQSSVLVDGFESGSLGRNWEVTQDQRTADATVVSERAYAGSRSLRVHIGQTGSGDYGLRSDFETPVQDGQVFTCWCHPTGTDAKLVYDLRSADDPAENRVTVRLAPFGDVRYSGPGTDGAAVLHDSYAANQWQLLHLTLRPSDGEADIGYRRAADGVTVSETVAAPTQYDSVRVFAGDYYGNVDVYLDEVAYAPGE